MFSNWKQASENIQQKGTLKYFSEARHKFTQYSWQKNMDTVLAQTNMYFDSLQITKWYNTKINQD